MTVPFHVVGSFLSDLGSIPIIIAIMYSSGKYLPGIISMSIVVFYTIYLGGDSVVYSVIAFLLGVGPCFFFVKAFPSYIAIKRKVTCLLLSANSVILIYISLIVYIEANNYSLLYHNENIAVLIALAVASLIGMTISTLLKEHIFETDYLMMELERSEKLKIVSQIAASVAHEVRNPLTVVKGFLQLLLESADDKKKKYLTIALSELERAEYIITDYLNLAKPQTDHLELIEVSGFLGSIMEIMNSYSLIQNVEIKLNCNQRDLYLLADKPKLSQVLLNLIKNGVEAIPNTGEVLINAYSHHDVITIEIMDNGKGMSKENLDNLGTAFFTTKDTGTGLGILVTIRIVEALNGEIRFESEKGRGTKVTLRFPVAELEKKASLAALSK
ncbi:ATP-binding protein [Paenibacillus sp. FSL H8-0548]|nr:ATP-binding protein [Paenibacillus sp. FSL H8-0548]